MMPQWLAAHKTFLFDEHRLNHLTYVISMLNRLPQDILLLVFPNIVLIHDPTPTTELLGWTWFLMSLTTTFFVWIWRYVMSWRHWALFLGSLIFGYVSMYALSPLFFFSDPIRLYEPMVMFSLVGGYFTFESRWLKHIQIHKMAAWCWILLLSMHTGWLYHRWKEPTRIWRDVAETFPQSSLAWSEYGVALQDAKAYHEASVAFSVASKISPHKQAYLLKSLENGMYSGGNDQSVKDFLQSLSYEQMTVTELMNAANLMRRVGMFKESKQWSERVLVMNSKLWGVS